MNQSWFSNWKNGVKELNEAYGEIDKSRDEAYGLLSDKIKDIFMRNGTPAKHIHFSSDCSVVTVQLDGNTSQAISFKKSFLFDIGMPFTVRRKLNEFAQNEMYVELYPLEDD